MIYTPKFDDWDAQFLTYPEAREEASWVRRGDFFMGFVFSKTLKVFRALWRLTVFLAICLVALMDFGWRTCCFGRLNYRKRALWAQRWAKQVLSCLHITATYSGKRPKNGVLAANHLGYLDILVLCAEQPLVFVSKAEVRGWPLIGWLTRCAGTLFIDRESKSDVASVASLFAPVIEEGVVLVLFPEGTSTGGDRVLPFMSSLFEPVATNRWPASAAWIGYSLADGSVSEEVCYWRNMTFLPHFLNLLSKPVVEAQVIYGNSICDGLNRKQMARLLHDQVQNLSMSQFKMA